MQNNYTKNLSVLLLGTLFISTSGVLGRYIAMPAEAIILCRAFLASIFIYIFCKFKKISFKINSAKDKRSFLMGGFLMGAHWVTYFYALKLSNVALAMLSIYTYPIITVFIEPFFSKKKIDGVHILMAILVLVGVYNLIPEFSIENTYLQGVLLGILSAFFYALRNLMVKEDVKKYNGSMLMFYQMVIISVLLLPTLFFSDYSNIESQLPWLLLVALLTTAIGHTLMVNSLQHFSATTASIISSIQPIFGIIIAFIFVNEIPSSSTFIGGSLILLTIVIESVRSKK
ncbi:EamA family transporter [Polaribacter sp. BM10]|uniref:DMT family transporter n=1 Tax=Polaribacter sp. BM10 TaxID=1529069 RepID=UPI000989FC36|nr:EamA family transporter [Polaribacter sp. BM10]AQS94191.1 EamA family transporter [Polaribacter sp. BM10]